MARPYSQFLLCQPFLSRLCYGAPPDTFLITLNTLLTREVIVGRDVADLYGLSFSEEWGEERRLEEQNVQF